MSREVALKELIRNRRTRDALREQTEIANMPYEEYNKEPCSPALKRKLPVTDVAETARIVVRLQGNVDTIDCMEQQWNRDTADFQHKEDRFRDKLHHSQCTIECRSAAKGHGIGKDMLKEHHTKNQEAN